MTGESSSSPAPRWRVPEHLRVPWGLRDALQYILAWIGSQVLLGLVTVWLAATTSWGKAFYRGMVSGNSAVVFSYDLISAAIGVALVWLFLRKYHVGWRTVGWRKVSILKVLLYVVGVLVAFVILANVVQLLAVLFIPGFNPNQAQDTGYKVSGSGPSLSFVALVLLPPMLEETIFRGFLFPALAKGWGTILGAIVSSLLFGLAHGQINVILYTMPLGLLLCWLYARTKSIIPGILVHMINNYLAYLDMAAR